MLWDKLKDSFYCPKNSDVESFLKNKAVLFDKTHNARTYVIINDEAKLLAYFALSFKEVLLPLDLPKTQIKDIDGISKNAKFSRGFLLGQVGKNFFDGNDIKISDIFDEIYRVLIKSQGLIGGRVLFLECLNNNKLKELYQNQGFKFLKVKEEHRELNLQFDEKMIVMYKKLYFD